MSQSLKQDKLSVTWFAPFSDCNVITKFRTATSASSAASSKLPVIFFQKLSHIPLLQYFGQQRVTVK